MALIDVVTKNQDAALTASEFNQFLEALKTAARGINTLDVKASTGTFTGAVNFLGSVFIDGEEGPYQKYWEGENIIFVGKNGGTYDGVNYTGKSPDKALSSFQDAVNNADEILGVIPSESNPIGIVCNDAGIYAESLITRDYVSINAPLATLELGGVGSKQLVIKNCSVIFHNITRPSGTNDMIVFGSTADSQHLKVDSIIDYGSGTSLSQTTSIQAHLSCDTMIQYGGGKCISDDSTTTSHLHVNMNAMYLFSNNAIGIYKTRPGSIAGFITEIANSGVESGTTAIYCSDGSVNLSLVEIEANIAYNVFNNGNVTIYANELEGTQINSASVSVVTPAILSQALDDIEGKEEYLGLPGIDGQVLSSLTNGIRSWITPGNMLKVIYDPSNVNADAFSFENHYGNYLDLNVNGDPDYQEGRLHWNTEENTLNIDTGISDTSIQVGQEALIRIHNITASSFQNGRCVYMDDTMTNGVPNAQLAIASNFNTLQSKLAITTGIISPGVDGFATVEGKVRGFDTSGLSLGNVYLSDTTPGMLTSTAPVFPSYVVSLGGILDSSVDGSMYVDIKDAINDSFRNFWNGIFREPMNFLVTSDGSTITGSLTPDGTQDYLTMIFSDGMYRLDASSPINIPLTSGTISVPVKNYVYIPISTKVLTVSTSDWPVGEHIRVAETVLQSASYTQTYGALANRNWNDDIEGSDGQGDLTHITRWLRNRPASWLSGVQGTVTQASLTQLYFSNTAGKVFQKHVQTFDALNQQTGDPIFVVNDPVNPYSVCTNLTQKTVDANNATLLDRYYNLVIWGVNSQSGEPSQLMMNLPRGSYDTLAGAVNDVSNFDVLTIPALFNGIGFLIGRYTIRYWDPVGTPPAQWDLLNSTDLRGTVPSAGAGGTGSGGATEFTALTDTPSSYIGKAGDAVVVNNTETALEFINGVNGSFTSNDGKTIIVTNGIITSIV